MAVSVDIKQSYRERLVKSKEEVEKKNGKSLPEPDEEKEKRIDDASQLRMPDRVPVTIQTGVFAAKYVGLPLSSMYYDQTAFRTASLITALEFDADTGGGTGPTTNSGAVMELLDT